MHDIQDVMRILGWSEHQVRVRLDEFRSILAEALRRGDHNRILVDSNGLAILQRVKELEAQGHTLKEIKTILEAELGRGEIESSSSASSLGIEADRNSPKRVESNVAPTDRAEGLSLLLEELRRQVEAWQKEAQAWREQAEAKDKQIAELLTQLRDLQQKALPPARSPRTGWARFWRRLRRSGPPSEA